PLELTIRRADDPFFPIHPVLVAAPVPGFVLDGASQYAFVVTTDFGEDTSFDGSAVPHAFGQALTEPTLAPLLECLPDLGLDRSELATATVFSTQDTLSELRSLRDHSASLAPGPVVDNWQWLEDESVAGSYETWRGEVDVPIYQRGDSPYWVEGEMVFDDEGTPVVQRWEKVAFALSFPVDIKEPRHVLIWQSGARADLTGWVNRPLARDFRQAGFAIIKFLPQFHGERNVDGGDLDLHTYNYLNPAAGRAVLRQEVLDVSWFVRVVRESLGDLEGVPLLETDYLTLIGHSQGAEVGAMVAAVEPEVDAFLLHGVGTYLSETIVHRTDPFDVPATLQDFFGIGEVDRFHPLIQLIQLGGDVVDPSNHLKAWKGWSGDTDGSHVLMVNGYHDQDVYFVSMNAMTIGGDATVAEPAGWDVDPFDVWDVDAVATPIVDNREALSGAPITLASVLFADGDHYTLYENKEARDIGVWFLQSGVDASPEVDF
ncbi:MAG: hypothetical protein HN348_29660, partial [Proteobacteria bacterium]|nr:hypothetical protein [Pseudomonadota bacterium]